MQILDIEAGEERRKCRFSRRKRARREANADLRGGGQRGKKEIQRRRGNADLAGGSGRGEKEMQI